MRSVGRLPAGYYKYYSVDLQNDKKIKLFITILSVLVAVAVYLCGYFTISFDHIFNTDMGIVFPIICLVSTILLVVVYILLHELTHAAAMRICGTKTMKFGTAGNYAYVGSDDFYGKWAYIFIALSPIVLWGIIIAVITSFISPAWFWVVYPIQIINISGAVGDLFVTFRILFFPKDILIKDEGLSMTVYSKKRKKDYLE